MAAAAPLRGRRRARSAPTIPVWDRTPSSSECGKSGCSPLEPLLRYSSWKFSLPRPLDRVVPEGVPGHGPEVVAIGAAAGETRSTRLRSQPAPLEFVPGVPDPAVGLPFSPREPTSPATSTTATRTPRPHRSAATRRRPAGRADRPGRPQAEQRESRRGDQDRAGGVASSASNVGDRSRRARPARGPDRQAGHCHRHLAASRRTRPGHTIRKNASASGSARTQPRLCPISAKPASTPAPPSEGPEAARAAHAGSRRTRRPRARASTGPRLRSCSRRARRSERR